MTLSIVQALPRFLPPPTQIATGLRGLMAMPQRLQAPLLNSLLNQTLKQQRQDGELDFLEQRVLQIQIEDLALNWFISAHNGQLKLEFQGQADACIRGQWLSFAMMACHYCDPDTLFFQRRLQLSGDTELSLAVKNLLDSIEADALPKHLQLGLKGLGYYLDQWGEAL